MFELLAGTEHLKNQSYILSFILQLLLPNQAVVLCSWCHLAVSSLPRAVLRLNTGRFTVPRIQCFLLSHFFPFAVGNYTQAIECAKTYLLFFPNDEVMSQNLAYYTAMLGEEQARSIGPREVRDLHYFGWLPAEPRPESREWGRGGGAGAARAVRGGGRLPGWV